MKLVILAGGYGSRISEESTIKPKPLIEIGNKPIIWHIMKHYSVYGINDFIICCGYKSYLIKEYFANYSLHNSDITFHLNNNSLTVHNDRSEPWNVSLIDTGEDTMTGGRILRVKNYIEANEKFLLTYGDGLSNINIHNLIKFHNNNNKLATLSAVYPPARFGALELNKNQVISFKEKPKGDGAYINGGFFVLNYEVFKYIKNDQTIWEQEPLNNLANDKQLNAYLHDGFWHPMDTIRDKKYLNDLWAKKQAPWAIW